MNSKFYGSRFLQARMFYGLSLQDLGEKIGVSRQYLQKIESELCTPSEDILNCISEVLHVEPIFFSRPITNLLLENQCHFRKAKTTSANIKIRATQQAAMYAELVSFIDKYVDFPQIDFPQMEITDAESIELAAEKCRSHWKLGCDRPISNMIRVLENAGAVVTTFKDISDKIDAFSTSRSRPIIIENNVTACRMRFDLAHECGHLVMHEGIETGDAETESQAHRFASAFLLPREAFVKEFSFLQNAVRIPWKKLFDLKKRWKVSVAAILRRASDLKVITPIQYRNGCIYLSRTGQIKEELYDNVIPSEQPEVMLEALELLDNVGEIKHYLKETGMSSEFFEKLSGFKLSNINNVVSINQFR